MLPRVTVAVVAAVAYLAMAPVVVNGDGLGYLKAALDGTIYPGHVAYVPLLAAIAKLVHATRPIELLWPARVVSAAAAAIAIALVGRRGLAASIGLAASWGMLSAGSDVETYAPALAALVAAWWCAERQQAIAAGLCCALATLFHVENVLFVPVAFLLVERRVRFAVAAALPIAAVYGALVAAHGAAWLGGASHGLHYPLRATTPFVAVYGACKALVYAPYPYEASWARVFGCFAVGAAAACALATCMRRPLPALATAAWLVPYALVGVAFYASDAERWTFLLPLAWIAAADKPRRAIAVAAFVFAANLVLWLPVARDATIRERAVAADRSLRDGDVVIGPGHGWDEYVGFFGGPRVTTVPLVYWAGAVGRERLAATVARIADGHHVVYVRMHDAADPMGWKELRLFGITRENVRGFLPPGEELR